MKSKTHYVPLDGLRGIAILSVFCFHYPLYWRIGQWGWVGVDLFFVLSGFLISGILFDTLGSHRYFRNFYIRRSLRIFPLYWMFWIGVACLVPILHLNWLKGYWAWVLYVGNALPAYALHEGMDPNFYTNLAFHSVNGPTRYIVVGHFWTLCVEEQFYLLWPLVVWLVADRKKLMKICAGTILACLVARIAIPAITNTPLLHTDFFFKLMPLRLDALMLGSLIALWARGEDGIRTIRTSWVYLAGLLALIGIILSLRYEPTDQQQLWLSPWMQTYGLTLVAVAATTVIVAALTSKKIACILSWRPLVELGRVSYGFYILHWAASAVWAPHHQGYAKTCIKVLLYFAGTWCASWISFQYFELPFLRLKDRFARQANEKIPSPS